MSCLSRAVTAKKRTKIYDVHMVNRPTARFFDVSFSLLSTPSCFLPVALPAS